MKGRSLDKIKVAFFWSSSVSMFILIAVASCTSSQTFSEIYMLVADFLSLSKTHLVLALRGSPGFGHFLCYCLLSFSLCGIFLSRNRFIAPVVAGLFGVIMEFFQVFIPSRDASVVDIGVNVLGVGVGFGLFLLWDGFLWVFDGGFFRGVVGDNVE